MRKMHQYTPDEFAELMIKALPAFAENMKKLNLTEDTFPEWFDKFMGWMDVGTDMEEMCWGYEVRDIEESK